MRFSPVSSSALRALLFLGIHPERAVPVEELAASYRMNRAELEGVADVLSRLGLVEVGGEDGRGLRLVVDPEKIRMGWLIRRTEPDLDLVQCLAPDSGACPIERCCMLKHILNEARERFLESLDRFTLADCLASPTRRAALVRLWNRAAQSGGSAYGLPGRVGMDRPKGS